MRKLSFAQYMLFCKRHPVLAHKSAFYLYQKYQRLPVYMAWLCSRRMRGV